MADNSIIRRRRFRPTHFYSILISALVLFMLGLVSLVFLHGKSLADYFREQLEFTVIIKDNVNEKDVLDLQKKLESLPGVKSADYISKDDAAKIFASDNNEDFHDLLDYNPLFASVNLKLSAAYTGQDSIDAMQKRVMAFPQAGDFYYEQDLVSLMNDNLRKAGWIAFAIGVIFLVIAVSLIDGTIRLSMYSNRFLIRSMQLVGATRGFITWPFLKRSMWDGLLASLIAILLLMTLLNFTMQQIPDIAVLQNIQMTVALYFLIIAAGLLLSLACTQLSVRKYLRMKLDELY